MSVLYAVPFLSSPLRHPFTFLAAVAGVALSLAMLAPVRADPPPSPDPVPVWVWVPGPGAEGTWIFWGWQMPDSFAPLPYRRWKTGSPS